MGRFGECIVSTISFDNTRDNNQRAVAENITLKFEKPAFFAWCAIQEQMDTNYYDQLAEGLFVSAQQPPDERTQPYKTEVWKRGQNKFEFNYQYHPEANNVLYHIVLPEYCYLDESEIDRLRNKDVTIYTHQRRQCITLVYRGINYIHFSVKFTGPDENKFNELRTEPQPLIYDVSADKKELFSETPPI